MINAPEDMEFKFTEYEQKDVIFYSITALGIYTEEKIDYTTIYSQGSIFYSRMKRSEIDKMIMHAKSQFLLQ